MKARIWGGTVLAILLLGGDPSAQSQKAPPARPAPKPSSGSAPAASAPAQKSSAGAAKRRDPFHTVIVKKAPQQEEAIPTRLPPGKKGLVIAQLQIQGIVRGINEEWIAVVDNKTKRSYFLKEKDELYNGVVSKITADSVVFQENSMDAFGRTRTREVIRRLQAE